MTDDTPWVGHMDCLPQREARPDKTSKDAWISKLDCATAGPAVPAPGYGALYDVLVRAHNQAAYGKGNERHATGQPFAEQPIMKLTALYGPGFPLGQAGKKMQEALRLPKDAAVRELLGAVNYIAAYIITLEKGE